MSTQTLLPEDAYCAAWAGMPSCSLKRISALKKRFHSLKEAWLSPYGSFAKAGIDERTAERWEKARAQIQPERVWDVMQKESVSLLPFEHDLYPPLLREIPSPPAWLFVRGNPSPLSSLLPLAVVGTRKMTSYGKHVAERLVAELSKEPVAIVSGLAYGIDAYAHSACLSSGGYTAAILGGGIDTQTIYPAAHRGLAQKILEEGGALLSEYPPTTKPQRHSFPLRNRIIAGATKGTIVIEAPTSSGALLTAHLALEMNRDVFAVPGDILRNASAGTNALIKQGAVPVTSVFDILNVYGYEQKKPSSLPSSPASAGSPEETSIMNAFEEETLHIDDIIERTKLNTATVNTTLTQMEINGKVIHTGGGYYRRV